MKSKPRMVLVAVVSLILGFVAVFFVTALLDKFIWPSLFAGIPAGIIVFTFCLIIFKKKIKI